MVLTLHSQKQISRAFMFFRPKSLDVFKLLLPDMTWEVAGEERNVFLTFDDGPTPGITEWILKELSKYDAKATFFCLGKNAEQYPDLHEKIVAAGHKIGNHSYSHQKGWGVSLERYVEDVDFANQLLRSDLFRPPYGRITKTQARVLSERYHLVMGNIVSEDYSQLVSPRQCLHNVTEHVRPGSIVVFHDSIKAYRNMRYALPRTLEYLKKNGMASAVLEL